MGTRELYHCDGLGQIPTKITARLLGTPMRGICPACRYDAPLGPAGTVRRHTRPGSLFQSRRNSETGTVVEVYDLDAPGAPLDRGHQFESQAQEPRWMTYCVDHDRLCTHYTRADALSHASMPSGWCGVCAGTEPPDED